MPPIISAPRSKNLGILAVNRAGFLDRKLHPRLLGIALDFIDADSRILAIRSLLPLVPDDRRSILESCVQHQEALGTWELDSERSPWNYLRHPKEIEQQNPETGETDRIVLGTYGPGNARIDDLVALEYPRFFDAVPPPQHLDCEKFLGGVEDYLVNDTWILEEWLLVGQAQNERQPRSAPICHDGMVVEQVLSFADLRMELHLKNLVIRLRAGWDKILNNILGPWFDQRYPSGWPSKWSSRINRLNPLIQAPGNAVADAFWTNWKSNADEYTNLGLRDLRDGELHYWSRRVRENFGNSAGEMTLDGLQRVAVQEHFRLMDVWLLTMALLRSCPGSSM